jgi:hypothetical protein
METKGEFTVMTKVKTGMDAETVSSGFFSVLSFKSPFTASPQKEEKNSTSGDKSKAKPCSDILGWGYCPFPSPQTD